MKTIIAILVSAGVVGAGVRIHAENAYLDPTPELQYSSYVGQHRPFMIFDAPDGSFRNTFVDAGGAIEFVEWRREETGGWYPKSQIAMDRTFGGTVQHPGANSPGSTSAAPSYYRSGTGELTTIRYLLNDDAWLEIENDSADVSIENGAVQIETSPYRNVGNPISSSSIRINNRLEVLE